MGKTTKTLLIISLVGIIGGLAFVTGLVNVQNAVALYVALPLGAVFLGLFLISKLLEKEVTLFEEEQKAHQSPANAAPIKTRKSVNFGCGHEHNPFLVK